MAVYKTYITVEASSGKHIYHFSYIVNDIFVGDEMIINDEVCKVIEIENRKEWCIIRLVKKSPVKANGGYTQLWIAVINQAVNDYRNYPEMRSEVVRFLKSNYFEKMTGVKGEVILNRLKKEVK